MYRQDVMTIVAALDNGEKFLKYQWIDLHLASINHSKEMDPTDGSNL